MKTPLCSGLLCGAILVLTIPRGFAGETPRFGGTRLPVPPQQTQPWPVPESAIPPEAVSEMADLFDEGFADPRGCEYRAIKVVTGSCWGDASVTDTHGWVMPSGDKPSFAVCWNGLVYPAVSVGAPADLRADIHAMLEKYQAQLNEQRARFDQSEKQAEDRAKREGKEYHHTDWPLRWNSRVIPEAENVSLRTLRPLETAMLLRLGETELAAKVWSQWFSVELQRKSPDLHLNLAKDWEWALFDRAVCAHMRGDDHLSLADARMLADLRPVKVALSKHGAGRTEQPLDFLEPLPDLIADEQRRLDEPAYVPVLEMEHLPKGKEYIEGLIRDLELAAARQMGQPGGVDLAEDPNVAALIHAGDDAVEPLLDCLENDTRLTRSVRFGRDFSPYRTLLGVQEAAYAALASILQQDFFGSGSTADSLTAHGLEGRRKVAADIRAYWQKNKSLPLPERWYRTLNDDQAAPEQWLEAADNIVQDADVAATRSSMFGGGLIMIPRRAPGTVPAMSGEALRARADPGVSELLIRRMQGLSAPMNQFPDTNLRTKTQLALALAKWDGKNHLDVLRAVSEVLKERFSAAIAHHTYGSVGELVKVYQARIEAGDARTLADYAAWVPTISREGLDFSIPTLFEIMEEHPDDPAIRQAAEKVFTNKDSPWVPLLNKKSGFIGDLFTSPLVGLEAFRVELLRGLADVSPAGSVTVEKGYVNLSVDGGWQTGGGQSYGDPLAPADGSITRFRVCDLYAYEISRLEGAPDFRLYWPETKRDEAVSACTRFLRRYGDLYRYQPDDREDIGFRREATIHFPRLDHPATPEDVEQNRAIFSLDGERRTWPMPKFPLAASWTTLKDNPNLTNTVDADGNQTTSVYYFTEGHVFQAEEMFINGKWERYFGFVGAHHIARVPASEIELPSQTMQPLSHGFECEIIGPEKTVPDADCPLTMTLKLRNRSGLDQTVPGAVLLPRGSGLRLPHAVTLMAEYTDKHGQSYVPDPEWKAVPPKEGVTTVDPQADGPVLESAKECTLLSIDLRDFFDLTRPGRYRVHANFNDAAALSGKSNQAMFIVAPERD